MKTEKAKTTTRTKKARANVAKHSKTNKAVAKPVKVVKYKARGKYKIVDGVGQTSIEPSCAEYRTED